jgi:two-component system, chemotaxis family, response regulator Rcp1
MPDSPLILIIDDNPGDRELVISAFEANRIDAKFATAADGREGVQVLDSLMSKGRCPNLVMLDLNMPGMNGLDVLEYMTKHDICQKSPVVIFTTSDRKDERERCFELGAKLYCVKPRLLDDLVSLTRQLHRHVARLN